MLKLFWRKLKQNHLLMMALCCLVPLVLFVGFLSLFKGSGDYWIWLIVLLCPLMHFWMMRGHKHGNVCSEKELDKRTTLYQCPECGLEYQEKAWAEKCEGWCKEHKSCNVEITRHAVINQKVE